MKRTDYSQMPDEQLAEVCARRPVEEDAWDAMYKRYFHYVQKCVWRKLGSQREVVADGVQDVFVNLFKGLLTYDPSKSSLKTYISNLANNSSISTLRHDLKKVSSTVSLEDVMQGFQTQAAANPEMLRRLVEQVINNLRDPVKIAIIRDVYAEKTSSEIQATHGVSRNKVTSARNWLRDRIVEIGAELPEY